MGQYVTMDQAHNFEINERTYNLVEMMDEVDPAPRDWVSPYAMDCLEIGKTVYVWAVGKLRRGVVSKIGPHRVTVVFVTPSAMAEAALCHGGGAVVRVSEKASHLDLIYYPAPDAPVESDTEDNRCADCLEDLDEHCQERQECECACEDKCLSEAEDTKRDPRAVAFQEARYVEDLRRAESPVTADRSTGSAVVRTLEKVWTRIREDHPELPDVVIVTGSGMTQDNKWGHFRPEGWKIREEGAALTRHELFLAGEALAKGSRQVLQTMLHEGAHTLARVRDLKDTSRQGRWHNQTFRKMAEEMGLEHRSSKANTQHGFSFVTLTEATTERYADLLVELDREIRLTCHLPLWMGGTEDEEDRGGEKIPGKPRTEAKSQSGNIKAVCRCEDPLIIRLSRKVLETRAVCCELCGSCFLPA